MNYTNIGSLFTKKTKAGKKFLSGYIQLDAKYIKDEKKIEEICDALKSGKQIECYLNVWESKNPDAKVKTFSKLSLGKIL